MKLRESNQYFEGYQACKSLSSPELCPYMKGSQYWKDWNKGYDACLYEKAQRQFDNTNHQFESLAPSQQPAWNGEGLPPVGVTCEHCPGGTTQTEWEIVTVLGISERPGGVFTDYWLRKEDGSTYIIGNPYRFRPIRTEADRRREEAIEEIAYLIGRGTFSEDASGIYDAIAAGKIPGVKLEVAHE